MVLRKDHWSHHLCAHVIEASMHPKLHALGSTGSATLMGTGTSEGDTNLLIVVVAITVPGTTNLNMRAGRGEL